MNAYAYGARSLRAILLPIPFAHIRRARIPAVESSYHHAVADTFARFNLPSATKSVYVQPRRVVISRLVCLSFVCVGGCVFV